MMNALRAELALFLSAMGLLTRVPMPRWIGWAGDLMNQSSRYFAVVGALIGLAGGLVWWLAALVLPAMAAAGLALAAMVLLTGALHEDGLADCADGLGGGKFGDEALEIMRDSRVGTYGALALVFSVGLRWVALAALAPVWGVLALAIAGGIGRAMMVPATALAGYARREGLGGSLAGGAGGVEVSAALGTALVLGIVGGWAGLLALVLAAAVSGGFLFYMTRRVGGYTGDGLGAMAQLAEITAMLVLAGAWA
jgi:adenosylcobinamide-GDP ribazoletransferase